MNRSPPTNRSRKRYRQLHFDLNRSTPQLSNKICKPNTPDPNQEKVSEMSQQEDQIRDMSQTIMSGASSRQPVGGTVQGNRAAQSMARQAVSEKMEETIKKIVDQSVNSQMAEMKRMVTELTSTVGRLSIVVQQTQLENKQYKESLPNTSKNIRGSTEKMETSHAPSQSNHSSRASSCNSREQCRHDGRQRVDKWGLEFDGDNNKLAVEDFVFRLERLQSQYLVPWKEVLDDFHLLVKGAAERWYWLFIQTNYVTEWNTLKQALLKQYRSSRSSFELMRDMVERRQQPGETIDAFFFAMTQLRSRLTISMPEAEMVKMLKRNLRESIGRIVYPMSVSSVEELRMCCLDAEKTFLKREIKPQQTSNFRYVRQVNELCEEPQEAYDTEETRVEEIAGIGAHKMDNPPTKTLICWNCRQNGHMFMDCPSNERSIFCFKCGKPDVTAPTCSNCRNRNFRVNEGRAGSHRSTADPQMKN